MTPSSKKTVVIDTNLFLHYKRADQLNWKALQSADIELVVPAIVVRELEKAKNFGNSSRLKTRAAETITWLSKLMDQGFEVELKKGLRLRFETNEPDIDFPANSLIRELQDDVLIAGLINLAKNTSNRPVLATADLGVKSKARQRGFEVFAPVDADKLPEEPDPRDKELLELRKENLQFKNRQPRLKLAFTNGENRLNTSPPNSNPSTPPAKLDLIKQQHPFLESARDSTHTAPLYQLVSVLTVIPESRRVAYNDNLQRFYYDYEKYLNRLEKYQAMARCRIELQFELFNEGTALATDIDIVLTFPEGAHVFKDIKLTQEPKPPTPPEKPTSALLGANLFESQNHDLSEFRNFSPPPGLFPRPVLNWSLEVEGNRVHFRLDRLKPEFNWFLPQIWLQFPNEEAIQSTTVYVDVSTAESSGRAPHQLHVIVG